MCLSRRSFLKLISATSAGIIVSSGLQACQSASSSNDMRELDDAVDSVSAEIFQHGVASGDPLMDSVILWTRVTLATVESVDVIWEVATDREFKNLVNRDSSTVDEATDYTLKVDVKGLEAGNIYYYRFIVNNITSPVGQTKTLGLDPNSVKFAVFSCANYPAGYFHVYRDAAKHAESFDAVLHLGDYIYEYAKDGYPEAGTGEEIDRVHSPIHECLTLSDYRLRYAQYHADQDLKELHAKAPFICIWDDHEIANDSYEDGAENHTDEMEGRFLDRKLAAIQAWYEWLPVRSPNIDEDKIKTYRRFDFGRILSLILLDTRVVSRDQQLNYLDYIDSEGGLTNIEALMSDVSLPERQMIGYDQLSWLESNLIDSKSNNIAWQVLGQQVLMARLHIPASLVRLDPETGRPNPLNFIVYYNVYIAYRTLAQNIISNLTEQGRIDSYISQIADYEEKTQSEREFTLLGLVKQEDSALYESLFSELKTDEQQAILENGDLLNPEFNPKVPYNLDAWDGYAAERERVLNLFSNIDAKLLVLSGDSHNGWCNYITNDNDEQIGVEFATSSVSSPGLEVDIQIRGGYEVFLQNSIVSFVEDVEYCNSSQRGYLTIEFTENSVNADWYLIEREAEKYSTFPDFELDKSIFVSRENLSIETLE